MTANISTPILLTGGNGFLGQAICKVLSRQGAEVVCASRSNIDQPSVKHVPISGIDAATDWTDALEKVRVVIHSAARVHVMNDSAADPLIEFRRVNVEGTLNLAKQAAAAGIRRFIFISSIKVNGEQTSLAIPFTSEDIPAPQDPYGVSKFEAEQGILLLAEQTGMEVVIVRPPLVYGPGVKANFASMMRWLYRGIPLPLGAINNKRSFVYIENLVSFIVSCIDHPDAANQIFLASDDQDVSTTELLKACASALGVKSRLLPVPQGLLVALVSAIGKNSVAQRLCGSLQLDISKSKQLLGWTPPFSLQQGLDETAKWFIDTESAKIQS
ncbi:MAG: SDR family oxidoreductase [Burkholderiales bacterium]